MSPLFPPADISLKLAIAIGIGMLVGMEREWSQKEVGIRTFTIAAMLGMLSVLAGTTLAYFAFGGILLIVLLAGMRSLQERKAVETTTSAAVLVVFVLGVLVGEGHHYTPIATAIVMTMLLSLKPALIHFAGGLQVNEIRGAVLLGLLAFVIYPILPSHPVDPWQLVNPREAWLTVIIIAALGFVNYVLLKIFSSRGLYYTAVLGGMVNSTATIAELSPFVAESKGEVASLAIVIDLLTVIAMFLRNFVILAIFARKAIITAAGPLLVMALASLLFIWAQRRRNLLQIGELKLSSPLALIRVLKFGLIFLAIEVVGTLGQRYFGHLGFLLVSLIGGLVSSASTAGAAAILAMHGQISPQTAAFATVLTSLTSALSNLPVLHAQLRQPKVTRKLVFVSSTIVVLGVVTMLLFQRFA